MAGPIESVSSDVFPLACGTPYHYRKRFDSFALSKMPDSHAEAMLREAERDIMRHVAKTIRGCRDCPECKVDTHKEKLEYEAATEIGIKASCRVSYCVRKPRIEPLPLTTRPPDGVQAFPEQFYSLRDLELDQRAEEQRELEQIAALTVEQDQGNYGSW